MTAEWPPHLFASRSYWSDECRPHPRSTCHGWNRRRRAREEDPTKFPGNQRASPEKIKKIDQPRPTSDVRKLGKNGVLSLWGALFACVSPMSSTCTIRMHKVNVGCMVKIMEEELVVGYKTNFCSYFLYVPVIQQNIKQVQRQHTVAISQPSIANKPPMDPEDTSLWSGSCWQNTKRAWAKHQRNTAPAPVRHQRTRTSGDNQTSRSKTRLKKTNDGHQKYIELRLGLVLPYEVGRGNFEPPFSKQTQLEDYPSNSSHCFSFEFVWK